MIQSSNMKVALLLPGYLDSPNYRHMKTFDRGLKKLNYKVERLDLCDLWKNHKIDNYTVTNSLKQIQDRVNYHKSEGANEVVLIGHSLGGLTAIIAGSRISKVTKIVALCTPPDTNHPKKEWNRGEVRISKRDLPTNSKKLITFAVPYSFLTDVSQYSAMEEVKKIDKPIMLFIALNDSVVLPKWSEKIVKNANNPYVVRQPDLGHDFRFSQKECNIVMKHIKAFLQ